MKNFKLLLMMGLLSVGLVFAGCGESKADKDNEEEIEEEIEEETEEKEEKKVEEKEETTTNAVETLEDYYSTVSGKQELETACKNALSANSNIFADVQVECMANTMVYKYVVKDGVTMDTSVIDKNLYNTVPNMIKQTENITGIEGILFEYVYEYEDGTYIYDNIFSSDDLPLTSDTSDNDGMTLEDLMNSNPEALEEANKTIDIVMEMYSEYYSDYNMEYVGNELIHTYTYREATVVDEAYLDKNLESGSKSVVENMEKNTGISGLRIRYIYLNPDGKELYNKAFSANGIVD